MYDVPRPDAIERACLVGFELPGSLVDGVNVSLNELRALTLTSGAEPAVELICRHAALHPAYCIGSGKADELAALCHANDVSLVIFDHDLAPVQARNLERVTDAKILDRTGLILQIFAQRARSREGKLQIELAQLQYLLPRLTRMWGHLSRQYGGLGTRGPGEMQLEVDRRRVQTRIQRLHSLIADVRKQRATQRKRRRLSDTPVIALVGYTNAGKSTLLRTLTHADVLIEDKLFATLDPTSRLYRTPAGEKFVFTDTVGFIRNLPHGLVEAFKATLEEVHEADALIHVADASIPDLAEQIAAVHVVLRELDADAKPQLLTLNKTDKLSHRRKKELQTAYPNAAFISAEYGYGFADMFTRLRPVLPIHRLRTKLRLPPHRSLLLSKLYKLGKVLSALYLEDGIVVEAYVPDSLVEETKRFRVKANGQPAGNGEGQAD